MKYSLLFLFFQANLLPKEFNCHWMRSMYLIGRLSFTGALVDVKKSFLDLLGGLPFNLF